jgi:hypothetical protein
MGSRRIGRMALTLAAVIGACFGPAPSAAAVPPNTDYTIDIRAVPISGTPDPYKLTAQIAGRGAGGYLAFQIRRRATTGWRPRQSHEYRVIRVHFVCDGSLIRCTVDTGTSMGPYGRIALTFHETTGATVTEKRCWRDGSLVSRTTSRPGRLGGELRVETGTTYFQTITNGSTTVHIPPTIGAVARRTVSFNNPCGALEPCDRALVLLAGDTDNGYLDALRPLPRGNGLFDWLSTTDLGLSSFTLQHLISATRTPGSILRVTSDHPAPMQAATLDIRSLEPFVGGTATFTGRGQIQEYESRCITRYRRGTFAGGRLVAHLDGWGDRGWPGTSSARLQRRSPAH